ncbi:hypothetical protein BCD64_05145 [Nostoc sp. MBR 210]|nr:hypothetical protein BCD64_05145 [Nostoc sp. MBR 210]
MWILPTLQRLKILQAMNQLILVFSIKNAVLCVYYPVVCIVGGSYLWRNLLYCVITQINLQTTQKIKYSFFTLM